MRKIIPAITTTSGSDWRGKVKEVINIGLEEVCLFPTCLEKKERQELYQLMEKTKIKKILFVHIRGDMDLEELDFLIERFGTQVFNIHSQSEYPMIYDYSKYKDILFIENTFSPLNEEELKNFGGICLDISHLENDRFFKKERFEHNVEVLEKYTIGCNHISCISEDIRIDEVEKCPRRDSHFLKNLSDLDYLKKYPLRYFSPFIALELENSLEEQLKAKDYIAEIIKRAI
ncbi:MAG: hypothetical protein COX37_00425 [Candidatus Nealsonbacteria bacterium CG23_combo_of_CG06-09_8_20_14_all_39_17]|uniref:Xylose isomerase-like TIM barrel domain-containing protein n=1 Tax=Candidatus Nealsonbacteria bacterium CG23_combo_of_CG06-09_8_20_14_all_39_17 TaxID=1974722 RepID=A0A2G9YV45_9BACT|nr:MAG: hypothetical protein COX37_00425 [Candidatus Nealsonbacteria bacterium CG23_combo_of_CG06-09_8_20_14_all_39_17]